MGDKLIAQMREMGYYPSFDPAIGLIWSPLDVYLSMD